MSVEKTEVVNCGGLDIEVTGDFVPVTAEAPSSFGLKKAVLITPEDEHVDVTEMMKYLEADEMLEELAYERIDEEEYDEDSDEAYDDDQDYEEEEIDEDGELYDEMNEAKDE